MELVYKLLIGLFSLFLSGAINYGIFRLLIGNTGRTDMLGGIVSIGIPIILTPILAMIFHITITHFLL